MTSFGKAERLKNIPSEFENAEPWQYVACAPEHLPEAIAHVPPEEQARINRLPAGRNSIMSGPELFSPTPSAARQRALAIAVCHQCAVRETCLETSLEIDTEKVSREDELPMKYEYGVMGGKAEDERRNMFLKRYKRRNSSEAA